MLWDRLLVGALCLWVAVYVGLMWWLLRRRPHRPIHQAQERPVLMNEPSNEIMALLLRLLTPEQQRDYVNTGGFRVQTASGRIYWVRPGNVSNVTELDKRGRELATWCIQTKNPVTIPSQQMAQLLLLSTDENAFRTIGVRSPCCHGPTD